MCGEREATFVVESEEHTHFIFVSLRHSSRKGTDSEEIESKVHRRFITNRGHNNQPKQTDPYNDSNDFPRLRISTLGKETSG